MTTTLEAAADAFYAAGNRLLAGDASAFSAIWAPWVSSARGTER